MRSIVCNSVLSLSNFFLLSSSSPFLFFTSSSTFINKPSTRKKNYKKKNLHKFLLTQNWRRGESNVVLLLPFSFTYKQSLTHSNSIQFTPTQRSESSKTPTQAPLPNKNHLLPPLIHAKKKNQKPHSITQIQFLVCKPLCQPSSFSAVWMFKTVMEKWWWWLWLWFWAWDFGWFGCWV